MTAEVPELDWALLKRITARVTAEVPGICRVLPDTVSASPQSKAISEITGITASRPSVNCIFLVHQREYIEAKIGFCSFGNLEYHRMVPHILPYLGILSNCLND